MLEQRGLRRVHSLQSALREVTLLACTVLKGHHVPVHARHRQRYRHPRNPPLHDARNHLASLLQRLEYYSTLLGGALTLESTMQMHMYVEMSCVYMSIQEDRHIHVRSA